MRTDAFTTSTQHPRKILTAETPAPDAEAAPGSGLGRPPGWPRPACRTWFAQPDARIGHELIAAGLLILAGVTDRGVVADALRVSYERGKGSLQGYDPTDATG